MSATEPAVTPPATARADADPARTGRRGRAGEGRAAWCPIDAAALPALDAKVAQYVDSIVALDVHSPAFTAKAGDVARRWATTTSAPRPRRRTGCSQSPVRAMQQGPLSRGREGRDDAARPPRAPIEDLDPKQATGTKKLLGIIPFGDKMRDYFRKYESAQIAHRRDHEGAVRRPGRAAQGQRRARAGEGAPLGDDAAAHPVRLHRRAPRRGAGHAKIAEIEADRPREGQGAARRRACSTCARSTRTC